ncbi:MAG: nucleoside triphosphate pyrophosphohydrolase [Gammaproteobacteria bacterium]
MSAQASGTNAITRLLEIMSRLRDPERGCPWDKGQSFRTIVPHTLEEAYEVADAIERGDMHDLRDELGDLLFQVVFYAQLGREQNLFDFHQIAAAIADKLVRRHPHVFGDVQFEDPAAVHAAWEAGKTKERHAKGKQEIPSQMDDVPLALPALSRAHKLQKRAAQVGFDWDEADEVFDKIDEELAEIRAAIRGGEGVERIREESGDLLFAVVNLTRHLKIDAEGALRAGNRKFERRFRALESELTKRGKQAGDCTLAQLDAVWEEIKHEV